MGFLNNVYRQRLSSIGMNEPEREKERERCAMKEKKYEKLQGKKIWIQ